MRKIRTSTKSFIYSISDIVQKSDLVYLYPTTTPYPAERSSMAVTVVVSVLSSFFVLAFITLVIWQLKNRNVTNRKTSQHISSLGGQRNVPLDTKETTKINHPVMIQDLVTNIHHRRTYQQISHTQASIAMCCSGKAPQAL